MDITFSKYAEPKSGALALTLTENDTFTGAAKDLDGALDGALTRAAEATRFKAQKGEVVELLAPGDLTLSRILLIGLGPAKDLNPLTAEQAGGVLAARLATTPDTALAIVAGTTGAEGVGEAALAAHVALGFRLRSYCFDHYRTTLKKEERPALKKITVLSDAASDAAKLFKVLNAVADGVFFTRDLVSEPANVLHPEEFAKRCAALSKLGVEVEILGEKEMRKLGMGALLGVGQGSVHESKLVVMRWNGGRTDDKGRPQGKPVAFVGKGVCFDTGGISLKPAQGMEDMKWDMGGGAAVAGLMRALAGRKARVNAVGVIGLVENMPDGNAQRPGDVVSTMSGQTIEVINTDAEGRLVLADALWYTQDRFKPQLMIDLATLTGNIIVTFGHEYGGVFTGEDELAGWLTEAGRAVGEEIWRQPLGAVYDKMINSPVADMKNHSGRPAGSITAAQLLKRFVNNVPWAHIDIAGTVWRAEARDLHGAGATGYGVRLLDRLIADHFETHGRVTASPKAGKKKSAKRARR